MEYGTIEREIHVDASPEVVFEVVSSPEHMREWWPDDARVRARRRARRRRSCSANAETGEPTIVRLDRGRRRPPERSRSAGCFAGRRPRTGNSLLVTFELVPSGAGHPLRMTETGFREMGWEVAVLEEQYHEHVSGWDFYLPRLGSVRRPAGSRRR